LTTTSQLRKLRADPGRLLDGTAWLLLYAMSLLAQGPCVIARILFFALLGLIVSLVTGASQHLLTETVPLVLGFAPLAFSALTLLVPDRSAWWFAQQIGARKPSERETVAYESALETLRETGGQFQEPRFFYVLDENTMNAAALGALLVINRPLLDSDYLTAVLAHELGHLNTPDAKVTLAINRLAFLHGFFVATRFPLGLFLSGELGMRIVGPLWGHWFRTREYQADQYAARMGEGEQLAEFLEIEALFYDRPIRFAFLSERSHPPTELRIDALTRLESSTSALADSEPRTQELAPSAGPVKPARNEALVHATAPAGLTGPTAGASGRPSPARGRTHKTPTTRQHT
jgi:Zn-dependent protease with chaperone function